MYASTNLFAEITVKHHRACLFLRRIFVAFHCFCLIVNLLGLFLVVDEQICDTCPHVPCVTCFQWNMQTYCRLFGYCSTFLTQQSLMTRSWVHIVRALSNCCYKGNTSDEWEVWPVCWYCHTVFRYRHHV